MELPTGTIHTRYTPNMGPKGMPPYRHNNGPIYIFSIEPNKLLYLQGPWLEDSKTYNMREPSEYDYEPGDENSSLCRYYNFPNSSFEIQRFPETGQVKRIIPKGSYIDPPYMEVCQKNRKILRNSELMNGTLEAIAETLAAT